MNVKIRCIRCKQDMVRVQAKKLMDENLDDVIVLDVEPCETCLRNARRDGRLAAKQTPDFEGEAQ